MGHVHHHRCTFTQGGQDLLRVLATEATTHETVLTDTSATSRAEKAPGQENRTVWNTKSDHPVSQEVAATLGHQQEQETPNGSSVDQQGSIQGKTGPRSKALANDEAKPDAERGLEEVTTEQDKVPEVRTEARTEAGTSSQHNGHQTGQSSFQNQTIRFW
jgi:hypothetical protein